MRQARKRLTKAQQNMLQSLEEEIKRANERADTLAKLSEIGQALVSIEASPGELERLLQRVAEYAQEVLHADVVTVYQYIQDRDEFLVPPVQVGELREPSVLRDKVFADDVVVKIVRGETLYSPDAQGEPSLSGPFEVERPERPEKRFVVREGIVSSAAVPLKAGTEIVGVMFINYRTSQSFEEEQRGYIELFANQTAVAIYNARLYEQASQRADTLARLSFVGQALVSLEASPGELERLLQQVAESAQEVLSADVVAIYQYIQDRDEFPVRCVRVGDLHHPIGPLVKVFDDDVVFKVVRGGSPLYSPDAQSVPQLSDPFEIERPGRPEKRFVVRESIVSSAAVPLKARDETVGVMFVNYRSPQPFTEGQREAIELFANQAAVAIRNARLFELISRQDELQRAYAALEEEQEKRIAAEKLKALGQAAANLAHRMNNLGGIIPVCVQELREQVVVDDDVKENLDIIEQQARLLLYAANDLLRPFAPSEEGEFDVNVLVKDALNATYPLLQDKIQVELRCSEELPKVKTTRLLGDVFVELITNAAKAMPDEGKLEIETKLVDERMIEVSFTDTGRGIPKKKQRWIFESFGAFEPELEEGKGQERPGIRFGLWWVKTFLQQQGGDVELRWSEVGKGSRFVVSHPVVS